MSRLRILLAVACFCRRWQFKPTNATSEMPQALMPPPYSARRAQQRERCLRIQQHEGFPHTIANPLVLLLAHCVLALGWPMLPQFDLGALCELRGQVEPLPSLREWVRGVYIFSSTPTPTKHFWLQKYQSPRLLSATCIVSPAHFGPHGNSQCERRPA